MRAQLVKQEADWPFLGTIVPGYPGLHPLDAGFWRIFWKLYVQAREAEAPPPPVPPLSP
ncbi:MAG: hypothetical protein MUF81_12275 [Verrucomicrobia bacterium]|nr:hypothetical protein [Verrucomicrobiota bacterium]